MALDIGDKVLVLPAVDDVPFAIKLEPVEVGDTVIIYNLKDETRIAVPRLEFEIGSQVFASPSFDFAGFDFKLDFDINLIPLTLLINFTSLDIKLWQGGSLYDLAFLQLDYPQTGDYYYHVGGSCVADVFIRPTSGNVGDIYINYTGSTIPEKHSKVFYRGSCLSWNQPGYYPATDEGKKVATVNFRTGSVSYRYDPC